MLDVLFVNSTQKLALSYEVNGTMLLATKLLQAGFRTKVLRFCQIESYEVNYDTFIRDITEKILELSPKCVSFYTLWPYYHIMLRIAREVKERRSDIVVVLGGPQASATAHATLEAIDYVDYVCTGEGENTVVPFFTAVLREANVGLEAIPGLHYRENGVAVFNDNKVPLCDLNALPRWDERLYAEDYRQAGKPLGLNSDIEYMPIDAGRGCPFKCSFCSSSTFWRRAYRLKSAETIIRDIHYYMDHFGIKQFWFSHDAFTVNKELVFHICDHIIDNGLDIRWRCASRVDCIDEELILKMKQAGLVHIELGVETGSPRMQKVINKNLNLSKVKQTVAFLLKHKIWVSLFFMYGFPEETEQDLNETLELYFPLVDMGVPYTSMSFCRFNPATQITQKYFDRLRFAPEIKILQRGVPFGFEQELPIIQENKAIFPFFYHLDTPLREDYQYLEVFAHLYFNHRVPMKYIRECYHGDNLKFYRDFCLANQHYLQEDMDSIVKATTQCGIDMMRNLAAIQDTPKAHQLQALLEFYGDCQMIARAEEGTELQKSYDFSYIDYQLKLRLEQFSVGKTLIRLRKTDGKLDMKVLRIE